MQKRPSVDPRVQQLFQRMADSFHGHLEITHVYPDGSAKITMASRLGDASVSSTRTSRRVSVVQASVPSGGKMEGVHLAKVEQVMRGRDPRPVFVSVRAGAVLSVLEL